MNQKLETMKKLAENAVCYMLNKVKAFNKDFTVEDTAELLKVTFKAYNKVLNDEDTKEIVKKTLNAFVMLTKDPEMKDIIKDAFTGINNYMSGVNESDIVDSNKMTEATETVLSLQNDSEVDGAVKETTKTITTFSEKLVSIFDRIFEKSEKEDIGDVEQ